MSSDESTGASGAGGLAQRVLDEHGEALRADGLALVLGPEAVGPDFVTRASEALAAAGAQTDGVTCVAIVTDPDAPLLGEDVPLEEERAALQEIAVRLADEAFPLVLTIIEARGIASVPTILVVGTDGVSADVGNSGRWPERFHDDFRVDPAPVLELAALQGAARLGAAETPDPRDYAGSGPERGDLTQYLETHEPGGADVLTAMTVAAVGGVGLVWFFGRRATLSEERERAALAARTPTPVPPDVLEQLPRLLDRTFPDIDPQEARSEAALDHAVALAEDIEAHRALRERIRGRLVPEGDGPDPAHGSREAPRARRDSAACTAEAVDPVLPPIEVAALLVLHAQLAHRVRTWESHVRSGAPVESAEAPLHCALNPFHGQAAIDGDSVVTATVAGRGAAIQVPACAECRDATGRDEPPDVLRVRMGRRVRPYVEVDDGYARSMFGALAPLAPACVRPPVSEPVGSRAVVPSMGRGMLRILGIPLLILLGAAVVGGALAILLSGLEGQEFYTAQEQAERAAETGPTVWGYPVWNWLRGLGFGSLFAVVLAVLGLIVVGFVRTMRSDDASGADDADRGGADDGTGGDSTDRETTDHDSTDRSRARTLLQREAP